MVELTEETHDVVGDLSTEALRKEVARLKSLLDADVDDDDSNEESYDVISPVQGRPTVATALDDVDSGDDDQFNHLAHRGFDHSTPMLPPDYTPEVTLTYSNGDEYKGEGVESIRHGRGLHQCSNGDFYDGGWKEDKRHGEGTMTYISGLRYEGSWAANKTEGKGVCRYPNGDKYEGEWRNDHRWGWGTLWFASGDVYEGEWVDDVVDGRGRYSYADKSFYQGTFARGLREKGKFSSGDGGLEYDGQWKDDFRHGVGTFHLSGVYKYDGAWKDDARHGQGKCVYADGTYYDGTWHENAYNGEGKYESAEETYEGGWSENLKHGGGSAKYADGGRYQGDWRQNEPEGIGKRMYPDGSVYEGQWVNGKRHGKGRMTNATNHEVYQGDWAKDARHGYGACTYADGSVFRGEWEEDFWLQSTADPTFTKVSGPGLSRGVAGEQTVFTIEARDEVKNKRLNGGDDFYVRFENSQTGDVAFADVVDRDDGTYAVKFQTTVAGAYACSVLIGADEHVADSPYPVRILPARPFPKLCEVTGDGVRSSKVGEDAVFCVRGVDRHGNAAQGNLSTHFPLDVSIASGDTTIDAVEIADDGHGQCQVSFTPSRKGFYRVEISSGGTPIAQSPYSLHVYEGDTPGEQNARKLDDTIAALPGDVIAQWEDIAQQEYAFDGDDGGWASEDSDKETDNEKTQREHPDVPIISNLEDLYKIPRLQRLQREQERRKKKNKLDEMRKRFQAEDKASKLALPTSDVAKGSIADLD
jgi:hypothetical protein|tara:strand:- start:794 stop:3058 length:2265 start_codon:yes stop_codon:yes gene_type:complete